ncbi:hypothetical protein JCM10207_003490 [Rhodosporidiobolus poonsookiae]
MHDSTIDEYELTQPPPAAQPPAHRSSRISTSSSFSSLDLAKPAVTPVPDLTGQHALAELAPTPSAAQQGSTRSRRLSISEPHNADSLPPVDTGVGAWTFVVFGFVLECFVWAYGYSFPSVLVYLQHTEPWSHSSLAQLSAIGSTLLALLFFVPVFAVSLLRRYNDWRRPILFAMVAVNSGSMLASSWATKTSHLIVLQGVLGGFSGAVLYAPVLLYLNDWFMEKRGLSSGIVFSGSSIGGAAFPFLINHILERYGFATLCRIWAGVTLVAFAPAVWFVKPRVPTSRVASGQRAPWLAASPKMLVDPIVLVVCAITLVASLPYYQVSFYLPTYVLSLGTSTSSTIVVALINGSASLGAVAVGWASDTSLPWTVVALGLASGAVALLAWGFASSLAAVFAFAVVYSFFTPIFSIWGAGAREAAGANPHLSTLIVGTFSVARGVASLVGPYIGTALYSPEDASSSSTWGHFGFARIIVFVGVVSGLGALGGPALVWAQRARRHAKARAGRAQ